MGQRKKVFHTFVRTDKTNSTHGLVKKYKPNKQTGKLELVEFIDPFDTVTPANNPFRTYPYRYKKGANKNV